MQLNELKDHLDGRLNKLETKIDNHIERISRTEESVAWLKGHAKVVTTLIMAALTWMAGALYTYLKGP